MAGLSAAPTHPRKQEGNNLNTCGAKKRNGSTYGLAPIKGRSAVHPARRTGAAGSQAANPAASASAALEEVPGSDWIYVEEGSELTAEQAARKFLSLIWEQQVETMERFLDDSGTATACQMLDHDGAMIFSRNHSCPPDRYQEGWQDAVKDLQRRVDEELGAKVQG